MSSELRPLPPDIAALLEAERQVSPPDEAARARVRGRVQATLGLTAAAAPLALLRSTGKVAAAKSTAIGVAGKIAIAVVAGSLGAASYVVLHHPAATRVVAAAVSAPAPPAPAPLPVITPAVPMPAAPPRRHAEEDAQSHLREERLLLEKARSALAAGDSVAALAAVERHARRFPSGQLAEERDCLRIGALTASGDCETVRREADDYARRYPHGLLTASACAGDGNE